MTIFMQDVIEMPSRGVVKVFDYSDALFSIGIFTYTLLKNQVLNKEERRDPLDSGSLILDSFSTG